MGRIQEYNEEVRIQNKQDVRTIEKEYVDNILNGLDNAIEMKRKDIEDKLISYIKENKIEKYNKDGDKYEIPNTNPLVIQKYFFQSINPLVNVEPLYSAEKLGIVWQLYEEMIGKISAKIGLIVPNLSSFCAFAGIRLSTFKNYKQSLDEDMRIVADKIEDGCFDSNVTLAQMGYIKERSTVYRMKSEQEKIEKESPIIYKEGDSVNIIQIKQRLQEIKGLSEKKSALENAIEVEAKDESRKLQRTRNKRNNR